MRESKKTENMLNKVFSLTIIFLSISAVFGQINTGNPTVPFGSNTSYEHGIMPTNLPSSGTYGASSDVAAAYNTWKSSYVENCGANMARVEFDNRAQTVSEGIAYGMLIAVYAGDQDLFNRLWAFYKNNRNRNGVMNWKIQGCSQGTPGQNGATDAELDAAMALIVASKQWPSTTSPHNYVTDGVALINAIKDWETAPDGTFYNGDLWHPDCRNPSYQAPAYARAYKLFMAENGTNQNDYWDNVANKTEILFSNNSNETSGLSTNWCLPSGIPNSSCSGSGTAPDKFGYDACRAPWRQAVDVIWWSPSSTGDVQTVINRQATFWTNKGGATTVQGSNNMNWNGSGSGDHNGAFTGMIGAMTLGASSSHQSLCNDLYTENLKSSMDRGYFTGILRIIGLFVQTGNFWNPYGEVDSSGGGGNDAPIVSITSPANNNSICLGESVTITASASDADGSISKVEFYEGNTLIITESIAPYSRSWTFTTAGTKNIKAIAYDNENETTTSTIVEVEVNSVPDEPSASDQEYCQGESAVQLSGSGSNLTWYTRASNGTGTSTAPTPSTNSAGTTDYYVSQTVNGCESDRYKVEVEVNESPNSPSTTDLDYCQGESANSLSASGSNLTWYTRETGGNVTSTPTPNTSVSGSTTYYVSQTVDGCESDRASLTVSVTSSEAPEVSDVDYCQGESADELTATGENLKWYASLSTNDRSSTAPTPSTNVTGSTSYYVSQTVDGCESDRSEIVVSIGDAAEAPVVEDVTYCQDEITTPLLAFGRNLLWYTRASGGNGSTSIIPNTTNDGETTYYVSQTVDGCESERASLTVTVNETPAAPDVTSEVTYLLGDEAEQLSAIGENLTWYTSRESDNGSETAPVPSTSVSGVTFYYVSETSSLGCESDRSEIEVIVSNALVVNKTSYAPAIDGVVDDIWEIAEANSYVNIIQGSINSSEDLSGTFKLLWDEDNFYVLGEVVDESKINDSEQYYKDDAIEVFFDFGNKKGLEYGQTDDQLTFRWDDNQAMSSNNSVSGITFDMIATDNGYNFEASFPWSLLGGQGIEGDIHGFEYQVNDDDNGGGRDAKLAWNATEDEAWRDPSLFGEIILGEEVSLCDKPAEAIIVNANSLTACEGETLRISANEVSGGLYKWFVDGEVLDGEIRNFIDVDEAGSYKVRIANDFIDNEVCYKESELSEAVFSTLPQPVIVGALKACIFSPTEVYEYSTEGTVGSSYSWRSSNAVVLSGENEADMTVEFSTGMGADIYVTETDQAGCVGIDSIYVEYDCVTSTSGDVLSDKSIFPNPFTDVIFVEDFTSYEIFDVSGKKILHGSVESGTINTSSLTTAVYVIKLTSEEGVKVLKMSRE